MTLKDKIITLNENPYPTIKKQLELGFTEKEALQNLKDSENKVLIVKDVKETIENYKILNCFCDLQEPYTCRSCLDIKEYFGDFKEV